jgi:hypothetical protein
MSSQDELVERLTRFYREAVDEVSSMPPVWVPGKRRRAGWLQPVLASAVLVALAIGLAVTIRLVRQDPHRTITPLPTASATPSPSPSASATATASPSLTATPTSWHSYVSPHWLYSVAYPATWYDLPNHGAPDNQKYFSNQNVGAPLEMGSGGVWLTVSVNAHPGSSCDAGMNGPGVTATPISIDGEPAMKYVSNTSVSAAVTHKSWCYNFSFFTDSAQTRDRNMNDMNAILASFRFNR